MKLSEYIHRLESLGQEIGGDPEVVIEFGGRSMVSRYEPATAEIQFVAPGVRQSTWTDPTEGRESIQVVKVW